MVEETMRTFSRRSFLGIFSAGVVGACVTTKIPTAWIPQPIQRYAACEYLRRIYNSYSSAGCYVEDLYVGRSLFEAYESEIGTVLRYTSNDSQGIPHLLFKGARVHEEDGGWEISRLSVYHANTRSVTYHIL